MASRIRLGNESSELQVLHLRSQEPVDAGGQLFIELAYESNAKRICIEMEYPEMEYIRDEEGHAQYFCARLVDGTSEILDITENVWRQTNGK